jgi:Tol biopolymer transport system component
VVLLAVLFAGPAGGATRQDVGLIVFSSNRTSALIPTEARVFDLRTGRSRRLGVVPDTLRDRALWSPDGRALAYVSDAGELYVVRPGHQARRIAWRLGDRTPAWSRDGRRIAFLGRDRGRLSVYVVRAFGGGLRRVATRIADAPDVLPGPALAWSGNDRMLSIVASQRGRYRLLVLDLESGRQRRLATGRGVPGWPDWSTDGGRIAFRAQVPGERAVIRIIDLRSGAPRAVHRGGGIPRWSPDGRRLAVDEKHSLWVFENGGPTRLVATHPPISDPPVWSPDSRRLLFRIGTQFVVAEAARRRTRRLFRELRRFYPASTPAWFSSHSLVYVGFREDPGDFDLHVIRADGSGVRALTANGVSELDPVWSSDGRRIAYGRARGRSNSDVYIMNADGTAQRLVIADGRSPSWSPDGGRLSFERGGDIWTVRVDSAGAAPLTASPELDRSPSWSPSGHEIAFSREESRLTPEIYAVQVATGTIRRVTSQRSFQIGCYGHAARSPRWSPDGRAIAYELDQGGAPSCIPSRGHQVTIQAIGADGTGSRLVTEGGYQDAFQDDGALSPAWSPDGMQIAFVSSIHDRTPPDGARSRIGIVSAYGGSFRLITPKTYFAYSPHWRP